MNGRAVEPLKTRTSTPPTRTPSSSPEPMARPPTRSSCPTRTRSWSSGPASPASDCTISGIPMPVEGRGAHQGRVRTTWPLHAWVHDGHLPARSSRHATRGNRDLRRAARTSTGFHPVEAPVEAARTRISPSRSRPLTRADWWRGPDCRVGSNRFGPGHGRRSPTAPKLKRIRPFQPLGRRVVIRYRSTEGRGSLVRRRRSLTSPSGRAASAHRSSTLSPSS